MKRTQIYIDETTFDFLEKESRIGHKTISEIIRESIRIRMVNKQNEIIKKMEAIFGRWGDKEIDVNSYIRKLRKDRKL
jgi:predicted nucleic acid-binding protein